MMSFYEEVHILLSCTIPDAIKLNVNKLGHRITNKELVNMVLRAAVILLGSLALANGWDPDNTDKLPPDNPGIQLPPNCNCAPGGEKGDGFYNMLSLVSNYWDKYELPFSVPSIDYSQPTNNVCSALKVSEGTYLQVCRSHDSRNDRRAAISITAAIDYAMRAMHSCFKMGKTDTTCVQVTVHGCIGYNDATFNFGELGSIDSLDIRVGPKLGRTEDHGSDQNSLAGMPNHESHDDLGRRLLLSRRAQGNTPKRELLGLNIPPLDLTQRLTVGRVTIVRDVLYRTGASFALQIVNTHRSTQFSLDNFGDVLIGDMFAEMWKTFTDAGHDIRTLGTVQHAVTGGVEPGVLGNQIVRFAFAKLNSEPWIGSALPGITATELWDINNNDVNAIQGLLNMVEYALITNLLDENLESITFRVLRAINANSEPVAFDPNALAVTRHVGTIRIWTVFRFLGALLEKRSLTVEGTTFRPGDKSLAGRVFSSLGKNSADRVQAWTGEVCAPQANF